MNIHLEDFVLAHFYFAQVSSVIQLCPILCDPMNRSTPGLPVHHKLLEFTQTHAHRVGDANCWVIWELYVKLFEKLSDCFPKQLNHEARILEWIAFPFSRGPSQPTDRTQVFHLAGGFSVS